MSKRKFGVLINLKGRQSKDCFFFIIRFKITSGHTDSLKRNNGLIVCDIVQKLNLMSPFVVIIIIIFKKKKGESKEK